MSQREGTKEMDASDVIAVIDVTKVFRLGIWKRKTAVDNLSFSVPKGKVVGLLGPNGSGKSTTLKMTMGFLKPTAGEIVVCGHSSTDQRARSVIGYLPENPRFQRFLNATEILAYYGQLVGLSGKALLARTRELLERVGLTPAAKERVQGFSKGMTQRLAIAQALLNHPSLLIFDEPMSGLDPLGRMEIRSLISEIHRDMPNTTIFFSTHILADVEELCDSVALLKNGKLDTYCSVDELLKSDYERYDLVVKEIPEDLRRKWNIKSAPLTATGYSFEVEGTETLVEYLTELRRREVAVVTIHSHRKKLEQALFSSFGAIPHVTPTLKEGAKL